MSDLLLTEPSEKTESAVMAYRREFIESGETHINGSLGLFHYDEYGAWLRDVIAAREDHNPILGVPARTYLSVRPSDGRIIGTIQLRCRLDAYLEKRGGHIGYGVRPSERRKGYGSQQLALVLEKALALSIPRVMITCDRDNIASARVAERNGAQLTWEGYDEEDGYIRVYWIDLRGEPVVAAE